MILVRRHEWRVGVVEQWWQAGDHKPDQDQACHPTREDAQSHRDDGGYGDEQWQLEPDIIGFPSADSRKEHKSTAQTERKHQRQTEIPAAAGYHDHQDHKGRQRQKDMPRVCPEIREALKQRVVAGGECVTLEDPGVVGIVYGNPEDRIGVSQRPQRDHADVGVDAGDAVADLEVGCRGSVDIGSKAGDGDRRADQVFR